MLVLRANNQMRTAITLAQSEATTAFALRKVVPLLLLTGLFFLRAIGRGLVLALILTTGVRLFLPFSFIWSGGLVFLLRLFVLLRLVVIFRLLVILWLIGFIFILRVAPRGRDQE